jgi:hypothetical protein
MSYEAFLFYHAHMNYAQLGVLRTRAARYWRATNDDYSMRCLNPHVDLGIPFATSNAIREQLAISSHHRESWSAARLANGCPAL